MFCNANPFDRARGQDVYKILHFALIFGSVGRVFSPHCMKKCGQAVTDSRGLLFRARVVRKAVSGWKQMHIVHLELSVLVLGMLRKRDDGPRQSDLCSGEPTRGSQVLRLSKKIISQRSGMREGLYENGCWRNVMDKWDARLWVGGYFQERAKNAGGIEIQTISIDAGRRDGGWQDNIREKMVWSRVTQCFTRSHSWSIRHVFGTSLLRWRQKPLEAL